MAHIFIKQDVHTFTKTKNGEKQSALTLYFLDFCDPQSNDFPARHMMNYLPTAMVE